MSRDSLYNALRKLNVHVRRYYYPLINAYDCYQSLPVPNPLSVAEQVSREILILPVYPDLEEDDVHKICEMNKRS
jgi:Predicted pyridoxal phosphate-dependent enzyme apparently involved in regulation of cell wall biogenesis